MKTWLPLLIVLLALGCVSQTSHSNGLVVLEFGPDFSVVHQNEIVTFRARVQNQGSFPARNVWMELLGFDQDFCCTPAGQGPWRGGEKAPEEPECRYEEKHRDLKPPDPFWGTPGDELYCRWVYKVPDFKPGFKKTYNVILRVFSTYETDHLQKIQILSAAEILEGKPFPITRIEETFSPLKLEVSLPQPVRYNYDESTQSLEVPIEILVRNVGDGTPCLKNECKKPTEGWDKVQLKLEKADGMKIDCFEQENPITLELYRDEARIGCRLKIENIKGTGGEERTLHFKLIYSYFQDQQTTLTVEAI